MTTTLVPSDSASESAPDAPRVGIASALRRYAGVVADPHSYRSIAYLLVGLPLGTAWFAVLVTAASVGVSMLVVALLGIPILWASWYVVRAFANVERATATALSGQAVPTAPLASSAEGNVWRRLRTMSSERLRWRELAFLLLRFPVGIATFTVAVTALAVPALVAAAPFTAHFGGDQPFGDNAATPTLEDVAGSPWSWFLVPLGLLLLLPVAFHLMNALGAAVARWAGAWLQPDPR
jgi:Putative sensor